MEQILNSAQGCKVEMSATTEKYDNLFIIFIVPNPFSLKAYNVTIFTPTLYYDNTCVCLTSLNYETKLSREVFPCLNN